MSLWGQFSAPKKQLSSTFFHSITLAVMPKSNCCLRSPKQPMTMMATPHFTMLTIWICQSSETWSGKTLRISRQYSTNLEICRHKCCTPRTTWVKMRIGTGYQQFKMMMMEDKQQRSMTFWSLKTEILNLHIAAQASRLPRSLLKSPSTCAKLCSATQTIVSSHHQPKLANWWNSSWRDLSSWKGYTTKSSIKKKAKERKSSLFFSKALWSTCSLKSTKSSIDCLISIALWILKHMQLNYFKNSMEGKSNK